MPESYLPSLATSGENMASHREQIMEETGKFQIAYTGPTNIHSNILKLQAAFFVFNLSPTSR